jgi:EAL domain-containing protein (putative c-di-GMP-specific phosphodiesterase class I)
VKGQRGKAQPFHSALAPALLFTFLFQPFSFRYPFIFPLSFRRSGSLSVRENPRYRSICCGDRAAGAFADLRKYKLDISQDNPRMSDQKTMADRLIAALQQDEFVLYTQKIVPLSPQAGKWPFQEIYVRFTEEDAKLLPPGTFFPVLKECQLLPYLDRWVVNRLARWVRSALHVKPDWQVPRSNVNLSEEILLDRGYGSYLRRYVDNSYLSDGALAFDVGWDQAIDHQDGVRRLMAEVRPFSCGLTIAGFDGSEPAFVLAKLLQPNFVKLSSALLTDLEKSPAAVQRLTEINRRCRAAGIETIAEQIENTQLLEPLKRANTDFVQGFAVAPVHPL